MNKFFLSCLLTTLLFLVPAAAFLLPDAGTLANERRQSTPFPELPSRLTTGAIKGYFRDIDAFFSDHFPLRGPLLGLSMALHEAGGDSLNMDKCYRGKDGWLFLGNSYARCVDKLQGRIRQPESLLQRQTAEYVAMRDAAQQAGAAFFLLLGPDKGGVYPEFLPPVILPARERYIDPLLKRLREAGIQLYDPTERFAAAKANGRLYYRNDTHWNARGAHEAFEGFRLLAGLPPLPPFTFAPAPDAGTLGGDLADIGGYGKLPSSPEEHLTQVWQTPLVVHQQDGLSTNTHAVSDKTVWVFGDSFYWALKAYIEATFTEVRFFGHDQFWEVMDSPLPKPDMVLWVIVERSFARAK